MPVIPSGNVGQLNQNVSAFPDADPRIANIMNNSLAELGQAGERIGKSLFDAHVKAEDEMYRSKSSSELTKFGSDLENELKVKYADDPKGYTLEYSNRFEKERQRLLKDAPYERTRRLLDEESTRIKNRFDIGALDYENRRRVEFEKNSLFKDVEANNRRITLNPNSKDASEFWLNNVNSVEAQVKSGLIPREEAETYLRSVGKSQNSAYLDGLLDKENFRDGINYLEGKDPGLQGMYSYLDADDLSNYRDKFQRGMKASEEVKLAKLDSSIKDMKSSLLNGASLEPSRVQQMYKVVMSSKDPAKIDDFQNAIIVNQQLNKLKHTNMVDLAALSKIAPKFPEAPEDFNYNSRKSMVDQYLNQAKKIYDQKNSSADFYANTSTYMRDREAQALNPMGLGVFINEVTARQYQDGKEDPNVTTSNIKSHYTNAIGTSDGEEAVDMFRQIHTNIGNDENYGKFIYELSQGKDGSNKEGFTYQNTIIGQIAVSGEKDMDGRYVYDKYKGDVAQDLHESLKNYTKNLTFLNERVSDSEVTKEKDSFNRDFNKKYSAYFPGVSNTRKDYYQALGDLSYKAYVKYRTEGKSDSEARSMAMKNVMDTNFTFQPTNSSNLVIPNRNFQYSKEKIASAYDEVLENITPDDFTIPDNFKSLGGDFFVRKVNDYGTWVTRSSMDGADLYLKQYDKNGTYLGIAPVLSKDGKPFGFLYDNVIDFNESRYEKQRVAIEKKNLPDLKYQNLVTRSRKNKLKELEEYKGNPGLDSREILEKFRKDNAISDAYRAVRDSEREAQKIIDKSKKKDR